MWQRERKWLERREVERLVGLHERSDGTCSISQTPGEVIRVLVNEPSALVLCWLVACDANPELVFSPASGEHRLNPAGPVVKLEVQVERRVDERQVAERLREVAQLFACEPYLLGIETEVVSVRAHLLKG
jgi:hypothetical protein